MIGFLCCLFMRWLDIAKKVLAVHHVRLDFLFQRQVKEQTRLIVQTLQCLIINRVIYQVKEADPDQGILKIRNKLPLGCW